MPTTTSVWKRPFKGNITDVGPGGNIQFISDVTPLQDGGFVTATINQNRTSNPGNPGGDDILLRRYDMLGNPVGILGGSSLPLASFEYSTWLGDGSMNQASLATLSNGDFVHAFVNTSSGGSAIYVETYTASVSQKGISAFSEPAAGQTLSAPSITQLAGGGYMLSYSVRKSATDTDIVGRVYTPNAGLGLPFNINTDTDRQTNSQLATLSNGSVVAVYEDEYNGSTTDLDIRFTLISATGTTSFAGAFVEGAYRSNLESDPSVAALTGGGFVVTYTTRAQTGGNDDIGWAIHNNAGAVVSQGAVTTSANNENESSVTALADGGFMVTWENDTTGRTMGQRYDAAGGAVGPQIVFDVLGNFGSPDIETLRDGRVIVATSSGALNSDVSLSIWDPDRDMIEFGDFNGDGKADVLFSASSGGNFVGAMNGTSFTGATQTTSTPGGFKIAGIGDFDGDGKAEILFRAANGNLRITQSSNNATSGALPSSAQYKLAGVDDFDGDGKDDLLWRGNDGTLYITLMNGIDFKSGGTLGPTSSALSIMATGDMDGDGKADILWRGNDASLYVTLMNGQSYKAGGSPGASGLRFNFEGLADFDGDGKDDILWRDTTDGTMAVTLMDGLAFKAGSVLGGSGLGLHVAGVGDFNGDGKADIFWRSNGVSDGTYSTEVTLMNGLSYLSSGSPGPINASYNIIGDQHNFVL